VASRSFRPVALISIHPEYGDQILAGQKRVEFRKARFASAVTHVVLYATNPVQQIIGYFKVKGIVQASPGELWRRYRHVGGVGKKSFKAYYEDRTTGVAIKVGKVFGLRAPRPLKSLGPHLTPPQSFRYLPPSVVQQLASDTIGQR